MSDEQVDKSVYLRWGEQATDVEEARILVLEKRLFERAGDEPSRAFQRAASDLCKVIEGLHWATAKVRYLPNRYCPHCGARKLMVDGGQTYIASGCESYVHLVCNQCRYGFTDNPTGRWLCLKFSGTSARKRDKASHRLVVGQFAIDHPRNAKMLRRAEVG